MSTDIHGYAGKLLRVSLDDHRVTTEDIDNTVLEEYLGGVGLGAYYLYKELEAGIDPLSPENKLFFGTSPLSDNMFPGGGSVVLCFKSPLTGAWGESRCGGDFGPMLRRAGFDAIIVEGSSAEPVYLAVKNGAYELAPAGHLSGMLVNAKVEAIREEHTEENLQVMCIGPAGENLVKYATVMCEHRAAGRTGVGAVMGSKNLQAVAVFGDHRIQPADPDGVKLALREANGVIRESETAAGFKEHGTAGDIPANDAAGDWPTKNWLSNSWGKGERIYQKFFDEHLERNNPCYRGCAIACGRIASVKKGTYKTPTHEGCEYESLSAFTAFVVNEDIEAAVNATYLCNEYGLDTISAGGCIAFAMECAEYGLLGGREGDLELIWGNPEVLAPLVRMISTREGIGDLLAEGVRRAAQELGPESYEYAIHGKGLEGPAHDGRSGKALTIAYGTGNRGMCHIHPLEAMAYDSGNMDWGMRKYGLPDPETVDRWDEKGKGEAVKLLQDGLIVPDILDVCKFFMYAGINLDHLAAMLSAVTGREIDAVGLLAVGERVYNLQRMFNVREGFSRKDDILPKRVMEKPAFGIYENETRCAIVDYDAMLDEYYRARGWHRETGAPERWKLEELGLPG